MNIDVSIIVLSYNTKKLTEQCLKSLYKFTKKFSFEVIVIDNASEDDSLKMLSGFQKHNNFILIKNLKNVGFGRANNQGIDISKGRYVLLLNSDTIIENDAVSSLIEFMDGSNESGIASCKLVYPNKSSQSSGGYFPNIWRVIAWMCFIDDLPGMNRLLKPFHAKPFDFKEPTQVDWVMGSFFLIRKEVVNTIGKFDPDYFMYTEEVDYCYRAKKRGWSTWYVPTATIVHYGAGSGSNSFAIQNEFRGLTTFYSKHKSIYQQRFLKIVLFSGIIFRMIYFRIISNEKGYETYRKSLNYIT